MKTYLLFIFILINAALSEEYHVLKSDSNEVKFISDAPVENVEGVTDEIDGYLYFGDGDFTKNSQLYFEVNLNSLDTGIGLRNRHMRENYLETDKYPLTYYKGKIVDSTKINDSEFSVTSDGKISIHGVEKPLTVQAKIYKHDDQFRIKSQFDVKLSDFNIKIPSIMFYKINEDISLKLNFYIKLFESPKQ